MGSGAGLLGEIRDFLRDLRRELPDVFRAAPPPAPRPPRLPAPGSAAEAISARVVHWSGVMGLTYGRIRIKDQRSLWGSCSRQGNLNFNWRLTLAPPEVLDYVVIHELAHRIELNHSRNFWRHVAAFCPEHRERRRWLRKHGPALFQKQIMEQRGEIPFGPPAQGQLHAAASVE